MQTLMEKSERLQRYLEQDPANASLLSDLFDCACKLGDEPGAAHYLEAIRVVDKEKARFFTGVFHLTFKRVEQARACFEALLSEKNMPSVRYNLAFCYLSLRDAAKAVELLLPILSEAEQIPEVHLLLARSYHHVGNLEDALKHAKLYEENNATHAEVQGLLAIIYFDLEEFEQARNHAGHSLSLNKDNQDAVSVMTLIRFQQRQIGIEALEQASALNPKDVRLSWTLALAYMTRLEFELSEQILEAVLSNSTEFEVAELALAWCYLVNQKSEHALHILDNMLAKDSSNSDVLGLLALNHTLAGEYHLADKMLKQALFLNENNAFASLAQALIKGNHTPELRQEYFEKSIEKIMQYAFDVEA